MKKYAKTWKSRIEGDASTHWSSLPHPMSLNIKEDSKSNLFISASLEFMGAPIEHHAKHQSGSLYYKIEVNGEAIIQYHVANPRDSKKPIGINLHAVKEVPAGENCVEVFYRVSKNGSWDLLRYQNQRHLSVLTLPAE